MKKIIFFFLLLSFVPQNIMAIPKVFSEMFQRRYEAFASDSIKNFLGDLQDFRDACWAIYVDEQGEDDLPTELTYREELPENEAQFNFRSHIDNVIDEYLNDKIGEAVDILISEIDHQFDIDFAQAVWDAGFNWDECRDALINDFRDDLELDDQHDLRAEIAEICDDLQQDESTETASHESSTEDESEVQISVFPLIACYLRGSIGD